jgi:phosphate transport system substrate-binding protein
MRLFFHSSTGFMAGLTRFVALSLISTAMPVNAQAANLINGAGATFPQPLYSRWFSDYRKIDTSVAINYQGVGSSGGIRQLLAGTVDFGASDEPMTIEESSKTKSPVHHIPMAMGAVALSYNLPDKPDLKLTPELVADLFFGTIKKWNDPKIVAANPGINFPDLPVTIAYRSDGSGTTAVMTEYLSAVSPAWKAKAGQGKSVKWPVGVGGKGNAGVAGVIKQNPGTLGYVELVFAVSNDLPVAAIKNAAGQFVKPSVAAVTAAARAKVKDIIAADFKLSIINASGKEAYPVSSMTWILVPESMPTAKSVPFVAFMKWALGDNAQKTAESLHYAALPKEIRTAALERIGKIKFK